MWKNTKNNYGAIAKSFHWVIFFLLFVQITYGYFLDDFPKTYQPMTYNIHKLIGLTILVLMILRLFWALANIKPALPFDTLPWQRWAERCVHWLLYLVVIAMPLAGWIGSVAANHPPHLGDFNLNLPIEPSKATADAAFTVHGYLAITLIVLFCVHVLAALYHYFIKRDDVLRRMMPSQSH